MAGASEIEMTDVWSYFLENKRYYVESEDIFEIPRYSRNFTRMIKVYSAGTVQIVCSLFP